MTLWLEGTQFPLARWGPLAWGLAVLPAAVLVPLVAWLDRHEAEPRWLLAAVFLWGALGATLIAAAVNTVTLAALGPVATFALAAPASEELAKGFALWRLARRRPGFDGRLDGLVYGTMVALGFAMTENALYFGRAAAGILGVPLDEVFWLRAIQAPLAHPLFTSLTGLGLGLAAERPDGIVRRLAPPVGLALAMVAHATWNAAGLAGWLAEAYLGVFAPLLAVLAAVALAAAWRDRDVLRGELVPEVTAGVVDMAEYRELVEPGRRRARLRRALYRGGPRAWARLFRFYELAAGLAFARRRGRDAAELDLLRAGVRAARAGLPEGV